MKSWKKITELAHLKLTEEEESLIFPQVEAIIKYFEMIEKVPTDSIEPLTSPIEEEIFLREDQDVPTASEVKKLLLQSSYDLEDSFVKVPLVINSD